MPVNRSAAARSGRVLVEVCVESVDDAVAAARGGADRLELNSALALDGLTPSPGLLRESRRAVPRRVPIVAMARPRAGDFHYTPMEFRVLLRDADSLIAGGADGIAFGILTAERDVDVARCRQLMRVARSAREGGVFHRAFDRVRDPLRALEQLVDLGIRRIMTSGQQPTALRGATLIRRLVERAEGRIDILPAGGVRPSNAAGLVARTGCSQIHSSLRERGRTGMSTRLLSELIHSVRAI